MAALASARFEPKFALDRCVLPLFVAFAWLGILMGFGPEVAKKLAKHDFVFPLAVHFHAAVFVSWLVLLTTQMGLVRTGNVALHRKLGIVGAILAGCVVVMGVVVSYVVDHAKFGTPHSNPQFLSVQLGDIVNFFCLASAGLLLRRDPAAHKRLMLLATFTIVDAGFARWWGAGLEGALGKGFFGLWMADYLGDILLILGLGLYDLSTRRRLNPAYVAGAPFALAVQVLAIYLYTAPWWKPIATRLIGH